MIRPIVQTGSPVLREVAQPVNPAEVGSKKFRQLVSDMVETMRDAPGVGLAAPQIGVSLQLVVVEDRSDTLEEMDEQYISERKRTEVPLTVLVNPSIEYIGDAKVAFYEGCLSVAGYAAITERYEKVRVKALNEKGERIVLEWEGWPARILQHELDHLAGTLYIDRMDTRTFIDTDLFDDEDND